MLDASFPMLTRPIATSSERIAPSRFVGCLILSVMVERQGSGEAAALGEGYAEGSGRWTSVHLGVVRLVPLDPFSEKVATIEFAIVVFKDGSDQPISTP